MDPKSAGPSRRKQSEIIELLFFNRKIDQVSEYLEQHPQLQLIQLKDSQSNTILHQLAFQGHLDIIRLFVKQAKKRLRKSRQKQLYERDEKQQIVVWMNQQNNEGFTALLYAAFSGHLDIIKYLVEQWGVNDRLTTNTGLNPLHLSAQKNIVLTMLYFKDRININSIDSNNSTALHWASYMNNQMVVAYLLSEKQLTCINDRDDEGNTPLMLAVMYGNTRVVRRLLMAGADRYLANNQAKIPMDIALQAEFKTISAMLNEDYTCCDFVRFYCNVKLAYKPTNRSCTIPMVFIITSIVNNAIFNLNFMFRQWYPIYLEIILIATMMILYFTLLKGPEKAENRDQMELLRDGNQKMLKMFCFQCRNIIPKRGYHCDICHVCIQQYDHHCTWINNCVGKKNIGRFVFFLAFLMLTLAFIGSISILGELALIFDQPEKYSTIFQIRFSYDDLTQRIAMMGLAAVNILSSLFFVPVLMLFIVQIKNLLTNKTTYEHMRGPTKNGGPIKSKMQKYKSKVSMRNCRVMCSDNSSMTTSLSSNDQLDSVEEDSYERRLK